MANSAAATKPAQSVATKPVSKATESTRKPQESYVPSGDVREVISFKNLNKLTKKHGNDVNELAAIHTKYRARKEYKPVRRMADVFDVATKTWEMQQTGISLAKVEKLPANNPITAHKAGIGFKGYVGKDFLRLYWQKTENKQPLPAPIAWVSINGEEAISFDEYVAITNATK